MRKRCFATKTPMLIGILMAGVLTLFGCAGSSDQAKTTDETTIETTQFIPTKALEFDENGQPTPESAEQIYQDQMEKDYQEYVEREQEEAVKDYYMSLPDEDPDAALPGGH